MNFQAYNGLVFVNITHGGKGKEVELIVWDAPGWYKNFNLPGF
jgi:hypothetical protein